MMFQELMAELQAQQQSKRDFLTSEIAFIPDYSQETPKHDLFLGQGEEVRADQTKGAVSGLRFPVKPAAHDQIADRLDFPRKFYHRVAEAYPALWMELANKLIADHGSPFLLRTLEGKARALLSSRYRIIDHLDLIKCLSVELDKHKDKGTQFDRADLTDSHLHVALKFPLVKADLRLNDEVCGGCIIRNSETGHSASQILPRVWRKVCNNGLIVEQKQAGWKAIHLGSGTLADDQALYNSLQESLEALFENMGRVFDQLQASTNYMIPEGQRFLANVAREYKLTDAQRDNMFVAFGAETDLTLYGMVNSITAAAQKETDPEARYEMERLGGQVLNLSAKRLERLTLQEADVA